MKKYDDQDSVILLEGKRKVRSQDKNMLIQLGKILAQKTNKATLRSGNAAGADHCFSIGISSIDNSRFQVITPYTGHRKKYNKACKTITLDTINLAEEPEILYQSKNNQKTKQLVDKYASGIINQYTIKAAYIIRDTIKVLGTKDILPASFAIFYDDLNDKAQGGTGHTMNVCQQNNIPFVDQATWFKWLK
ncbi:MAG: hypothetical protein R6U03_05825 [Gillisia sp.]